MIFMERAAKRVAEPYIEDLYRHLEGQEVAKTQAALHDSMQQAFDAGDFEGMKQLAQEGVEIGALAPNYLAPGGPLERQREQVQFNRLRKEALDYADEHGSEAAMEMLTEGEFARELNRAERGEIEDILGARIAADEVARIQALEARRGEQIMGLVTDYYLDDNLPPVEQIPELLSAHEPEYIMRVVHATNRELERRRKLLAAGKDPDDTDPRENLGALEVSELYRQWADIQTHPDTDRMIRWAQDLVARQEMTPQQFNSLQGDSRRYEPMLLPVNDKIDEIEAVLRETFGEGDTEAIDMVNGTTMSAEALANRARTFLRETLVRGIPQPNGETVYPNQAGMAEILEQFYITELLPAVKDFDEDPGFFRFGRRRDRREALEVVTDPRDDDYELQPIEIAARTAAPADRAGLRLAAQALPVEPLRVFEQLLTAGQVMAAGNMLTEQLPIRQARRGETAGEKEQRITSNRAQMGLWQSRGLVHDYEYDPELDMWVVQLVPDGIIRPVGVAINR